jgi:hypothetical protein
MRGARIMRVGLWVQCTHLLLQMRALLLRHQPHAPLHFIAYVGGHLGRLQWQRVGWRPLGGPGAGVRQHSIESLTHARIAASAVCLTTACNVPFTMMSISISRGQLRGRD